MNLSRYIKISKRHSKPIDDLILKETVYINDRSTGLYISRQTKHQLADLVGIKPMSRDCWLAYRKNPYKFDMEGSHHRYYRKQPR